MPSQNNHENRNRWIELAIVTAASAITSGIAVTWSLSATLTEIKTKGDAQEKNIVVINSTIAAIQSTNNLHSTQIAVTDANYQNILRRLEEINQRLKR